MNTIALAPRRRAYDDGLGFRYELPAQQGDQSVDIVDVLTEFRFSEDATAWWITGRGGADRYLGALTDETSRSLSLALDFLDPDGDHVAQIYRDGKDAHWRSNPYAIVIEERDVSGAGVFELALAAGGGAAVRFRKTNQGVIHNGSGTRTGR